MKVETIRIGNLRDDVDAEKLQEGLYRVWGVQQVDMNVAQRHATISFDENAASIDDFKQAVLEQGYRLEDPS